MQNISVTISKITDFIKTDIWRIRSRNLPGKKVFFIKQLRIVLLVIRGFNEDYCVLRASALTFYSLLSIVPIVAMAFGIAKGFGYEKLLEKQLIENFQGQKEVLTQVVGFANSLLENTKGGMVAGIGVVILFWAVIKVLSHIEQSFNDIWKIEESRTLGRKFSDYISIMLTCPLLVIMSGSLNVFLTTQVNIIIERIALLGMFTEYKGQHWVRFVGRHNCRNNIPVRSMGIYIPPGRHSALQCYLWQFCRFPFVFNMDAA